MNRRGVFKAAAGAIAGAVAAPFVVRPTVKVGALTNEMNVDADKLQRGRMAANQVRYAESQPIGIAVGVAGGRIRYGDFVTVGSDGKVRTWDFATG